MSDEWVEVTADERFIKRERAKARELRNTPYFQNLLRQGICHYCHGHFPTEELTLDHLVPVSRGGRSTRAHSAGERVMATKVERHRETHIVTENWM